MILSICCRIERSDIVLKLKKIVIIITILLMLCLVRICYAKTSVSMWLTGINGNVYEANQQTLPINAIKWFGSG
jgi:hypothetical protein